MSIRKITVASTMRSTPVVIHSEATTWGALKDQLRSSFSDLEKMRVVVRETRNDLTSDDARLPEGEFAILMSPMQIKAGDGRLDIVQILRDVAQEFSDSIDTIIEGIENGDYDAEGVSDGEVSASLAADLRKLKEGRI